MQSAIMMRTEKNNHRVSGAPQPTTNNQQPTTVSPNAAVDFHLHFEGCIFPATLEKLGVEPREYAFDPAAGFYGFLDTLKRQLGLLKTERAFNLSLDGFFND